MHSLKLLRIIIYHFLATPTLALTQKRPTFNNWYPYYTNTINIATNDNCTTTLTSYRQNPDPSTCKAHAACLLGSVGELNKADMASASVFLGLAPSILATMGPSIGEIALLSSHRPLLSFMISLGSPSVYPERPMIYANPIESLEMKPGAFYIAAFNRKSTIVVFSITQYLVVGAAIVNVMMNSIELGQRTILSWKCVLNVMPLAWSVCSVAIQLIVATSFAYSRTLKNARSKDGTQKRPDSSLPQSSTPQQSNKSPSNKQLSQKSPTPTSHTSLLAREFLPTADHTPKLHFVEVLEPPGIVILNWLGPILSFLHVIFGTLLFSSLLFIGTLDALIVVVRYFVSAIVCRVVLLVEVAGLRDKEKSAASEKGSELSE